MSRFRPMITTGSSGTARWVALLVLCILALDLTDAACDPLVLSFGTASLSATQAGDGDPCAGTCVPDCFCCSSSVPAVQLSLAFPWVPSPVTVTPDIPSPSSGFPSFPDHVPIAA